MNTRAFYRTEGFDSAGQFAFQRALVVNLLAELTDAELFLIQQLEADRAAFRQALLGQAQTQLVHFLSGHHQRAALIIELIRNVHLGQLSDDGAAIFIAEVVVKHTVLRLFGPQHHGDYNGNGSRRSDDNRDARICL